MITSFISLLTQPDFKGIYDVSKAAMIRIKIRTVVIAGLAAIVLNIYPLDIVLSWLIPLLLIDLINVIVERKIIKDYERDQTITYSLRNFFLSISWMESFCIVGLFIHISILEGPTQHFVPYMIMLAATFYVVSCTFHSAIFLFVHLSLHSSAIIFVSIRDIYLTYPNTNSFIWAELFISLVFIFFTVDIARYFHTSYLENNQKTKELNEALEKAQSLTQLKSDLLSAVGHELRTPLNGILGFSKIMKTTELSPKQGEYINLIEDAGKDLNILLSNIMDSEAIERGRFAHSPIETNIPRLLYRLQKTFETMAQEKDVDILLDISKNFPTKVMIDETRLGQCVSNLLSNAIRFTNDGNITIRAFIIEDISSSKLHICVTDSGVGISKHHTNRIFDKFFKADDRISPSQGTGLGLWLIRNIAQGMNGDLHLITSSDSGSQFELTFNIKNKDINTSKKIGTLINKRILHIEDTQTNLMLVRILLEGKDATVTDATTGAKALELLRSNEFDIIICDLQLPDYDGNILLRDIRKLKNTNSKLPIIALTAQPEKIKHTNTNVSFSTILSKPIDPNLLLSTLVELNQSQL